MKPLPKVTSETRRFWDATRTGELHCQRCGACGKVQFPPSALCTDCWSTALEWRRCANHGTVYSFTLVERAPLAEFKCDVPYVIALVDIEAGFRIMVNVRGADAAQVSIGSPVEIFFEPTAREDIVLPQAKLLMTAAREI